MNSTVENWKRYMSSMTNSQKHILEKTNQGLISLWSSGLRCCFAAIGCSCSNMKPIAKSVDFYSTDFYTNGTCE